MAVTIHKGDAIPILQAMQDETVDCVLVDPPYGETSLKWDKWPIGWPTLVRRLLKPTGSMWVFGSMRMFLERVSEFEGWRLSHDVIWEKQNGTGFANDRFRRVHETALHFYRDDAPWGGVFKNPQTTPDAMRKRVNARRSTVTHTGKIGPHVFEREEGGPRLMRSILFARNEHGSGLHPTQKPLALVEPLLLYACPKGGHVLDPFAGSGTVGVLAQRHGMDCTLIEADDDFHELIERRLREDAPLLSAMAQ